MTDTVALPATDPSTPALPAPADRGRTTIGPGVVETIARTAANEVEGVAVHGSGLDKVVGRQYPQVSAEVAGSRARLTVQVAVVWPQPLAEVCAHVRDLVATRVSDLTGMTVDAVDVTAAKVVHPEPPTMRRVQ